MKGPEKIVQAIGDVKNRISDKLRNALPDVRQCPQPGKEVSFETEVLEPWQFIEPNDIGREYIIFNTGQTFNPEIFSS